MVNRIPSTWSLTLFPLPSRMYWWVCPGLCTTQKPIKGKERKRKRAQKTCVLSLLGYLPNSWTPSQFCLLQTLLLRYLPHTSISFDNSSLRILAQPRLHCSLFSFLHCIRACNQLTVNNYFLRTSLDSLTNTSHEIKVYFHLFSFLLYIFCRKIRFSFFLLRVFFWINMFEM